MSTVPAAGRAPLQRARALRRRLAAPLAVLALWMLSPCAGAADAPERTVEGLVRVDGTRLQSVYLRPGVDLSAYQRILLEPATVAFRSRWRQDQRIQRRLTVTVAEMDEIRSRLAAEMDRIFRSELEAGGYELVSEPDDDVLAVHPAIVELDVVAPDVRRAGRTQALAESAGEMTLELEWHDSVTGELLGKAVDRQADPRKSFPEWQSAARNRALAEAVLAGWAAALRQGLDEARSAGMR